MSDVKYLIFDIETVGDGDLIQVRYPVREFDASRSGHQIAANRRRRPEKTFSPAPLCCRCLLPLPKLPPIIA